MRTRMRNRFHHGRLAAGKCPEFQPAPERKLLSDCEGDFDFAFSGGSKRTCSSAVGLGGQWLLEHAKADFCGRTYEGRAVTSYDPTKGKDVTVWIDAVSPVPLVNEGIYEAAAKTLTFVGDIRAPDDSTIEAKTGFVCGSAGRRTLTVTIPGPSGAATEIFRIV